MADFEENKKCPYCSEQILITAKKCKHCGEWLEESKERKGTDWIEKGSVAARSVTKGLKQKEQDDRTQGCFGIAGLAGAIAIGVFVSRTFDSSKAGWIVGIIVFLVAIGLIAKWYYEE